MSGKQSEDYWRKKLTAEQYAVLRQKATEKPFTGALLHEVRQGTFRCAACGTELFDADTKFESGSGWPSFYDAKPGAIDFHEDTANGMVRTEVTCHTCGSHLGHIFPDAPQTPTGQRYCINSIALKFKEKNT
jgi:peptide-methionine (R)-S-oxide reductase